MGETFSDFNGSELQQLECGEASGKLFDFNMEEEVRNQSLVLRAIQDGFISACNDVSEGGLAVALSECCFEHGVGAEITLDMDTALIFAETQSRFVLSVPQDKQLAFEKIYGARCRKVGSVTASSTLHITTNNDEFSVPVAELKAGWEQTISQHM